MRVVPPNRASAVATPMLAVTEVPASGWPRRELEVFNRGSYLLGNFDGSRSVGGWENDGEFFSAVAGRDVSGAESRAECDGDGAQAIIADLVSVFVVERFEEIDIKQEKRYLGTFAQGPFPFAIQCLVKRAAIRKPREFIGERQGRQFLFQHLAFGDIAQDDDGLQGSSVPGSRRTRALTSTQMIFPLLVRVRTAIREGSAPWARLLFAAAASAGISSGTIRLNGGISNISSGVKPRTLNEEWETYRQLHVEPHATDDVCAVPSASS